MAFMVYRTCCQVEGGLPTNVRIQMLINIILDFLVGLVPFLGDLADAVFRANTRNAALLEEHLRQKGKKELRKSGMPVPAVDPSSAEEYDRIQREDPPSIGRTLRPAECLQPGAMTDTMTGITRSQEPRPRPQFAMTAAVIWVALARTMKRWAKFNQTDTTTALQVTAARRRASGTDSFNSNFPL